ncbi:MAG: isocitrate/isopropylmalate dehydrogenase family protein [Planctomycetota bacterium]|jgi:isocitrate dehydrogenase (NAD+)
MTTHTVVLLPGDGIGPEVAEATKRVMEASGADLKFISKQVGLGALESGSESLLPDDTVEAIRHHGVALKGPCTTPIGKGFTSVNVGLRKKLNLYAAVRPVRSLPGVLTRYENVDLVVIRENTEGLYSGVENVVTEGTVISVKVATQEACERISRFAFRYATHQKRKKVSVFHKANIMKLSDGLFLKESRNIYEQEYPNIDYEEVIVDAGSMRLVQDPSQFDIVLCENLYGDIMSDLCAGLVGGLGVTPGANIGEDQAVFEAVHGSAPDIAGQNKANPLALLLSGVMMLRYLGDTRRDKSCLEAAVKIQNACDQALIEGQKTRDLGGELGTKEFANALIERLG